MTEYLPRSAWTSSGPARPMEALDPSRVVGFAVHWPGTTVRITDHSRDAVARRLEGYRRYHVSTKGWSDIAYQVGVDAEGRVWDLRGIKWRSAGNGSDVGNDTYGAILLLLGPGDPVTDAMVDAVATWRREKWLARYPDATRVVGHRDIRPEPTECPGDAAYALVRDGSFTKGSSMTISNADAEKVAAAILGSDTVEMNDWEKVNDQWVPKDPKNPTGTVRTVLETGFRRDLQQLDQLRRILTELDALSKRVDALGVRLTEALPKLDQTVAAIGQLLAVGVNVDALAEKLAPAVADKVADVAAERLQS